MSPEFKECETLALQLPLKERAELAYRLIESLEEMEREWDPSELEKIWAEECERRYQAYKEGKIQAHDAEEVIREVRQQLNEIRPLP